MADPKNANGNWFKKLGFVLITAMVLGYTTFVFAQSIQTVTNTADIRTLKDSMNSIARSLESIDSKLPLKGNDQ